MICLLKPQLRLYVSWLIIASLPIACVELYAKDSPPEPPSLYMHEINEGTIVATKDFYETIGLPEDLNTNFDLHNNERFAEIFPLNLDFNSVFILLHEINKKSYYTIQLEAVKDKSLMAIRTYYIYDIAYDVTLIFGFDDGLLKSAIMHEQYKQSSLSGRGFVFESGPKPEKEQKE